METIKHEPSKTSIQKFWTLKTKTPYFSIYVFFLSHHESYSHISKHNTYLVLNPKQKRSQAIPLNNHIHGAPRIKALPLLEGPNLVKEW
jgi:hypothetical protein